jgi:hypothetical protein
MQHLHSVHPATVDGGELASGAPILASTRRVGRGAGAGEEAIAANAAGSPSPAREQETPQNSPGSVAGVAYAAFEDLAKTEFARDLAYIHGAAL